MARWVGGFLRVGRSDHGFIGKREHIFRKEAHKIGGRFTPFMKVSRNRKNERDMRNAGSEGAKVWLEETEVEEVEEEEKED